jgi:hypothetical protein
VGRGPDAGRSYFSTTSNGGYAGCYPRALGVVDAFAECQRLLLVFKLFTCCDPAAFWSRSDEATGSWSFEYDHGTTDVVTVLVMNVYLAETNKYSLYFSALAMHYRSLQDIKTNVTLYLPTERPK